MVRLLPRFSARLSLPASLNQRMIAVALGGQGIFVVCDLVEDCHYSTLPFTVCLES